MSVAELIAELEACPPDYEVIIDIGNIPGIGEVYGAFIEDITLEAHVVSVQTVAP